MAALKDTEQYLAITGMCLVLFFAIFGNILTILATCKFHTLQTRTHVLIVNLAVSDILIASLAAPLRIVQLFGSMWSTKLDNCKTIITLTSFFCNLSVFNLTLISVDRALSIASPLTYNHTSSRSKLVGQITLSWLLAFAVSFLPFAGYGWKTDKNYSVKQNVDVCRYLTVLDKNYVLLVFASAVFGPFLIMVVAYIYIFRVAVRHLKRISAVEFSIKRTVIANQETQDSPASSNGVRPRTKAKATTYRAHLFMKELKAAKMVAIVIGLFFLCVVPIVLVDITEIVCGYPCAPEWSVTFAVCLSYMNPAANIFAYATTSTDYRKAYRRILAYILCCKRSTI